MSVATPTLGNTRVRTHLQAQIFLGKNNIGSGRLESFDADHDAGTEPVYGIGDYEAAEFAPLKFTGSISMEAFMLRTSDLVALGVAALGTNILKMGIIDIYIYDPTPGAANNGIVRRYKGCALQRYRESIRAGQICGENATVFFQDVVDGTGQALPAA